MCIVSSPDSTPQLFITPCIKSRGVESGNEAKVCALVQSISIALCSILHCAYMYCVMCSNVCVLETNSQFAILATKTQPTVCSCQLLYPQQVPCQQQGPDSLQYVITTNSMHFEVDSKLSHTFSHSCRVLLVSVYF